MIKGLSNYILDIVDISIVYYIIYRLLLILKGTRAIQIMLGIFLLVFITFLSNIAGLKATFWLLQHFWFAGVFLLIVVFQPEIRNALANLGSDPFGRIIVPREYNFIIEIIKAAKEASAKKIGMLIVLEQDMGLKDFISTGIMINGEVSSQLILSIFSKKSPLHDGAVIISGNRLVASSCQLPLTERRDLSSIFGMRHRAAIGVSEVTDAIAIVVSEERGDVSVARNGQIMVKVDLKELERDLLSLYKSKTQRSLFRRIERV
ncbi:MAG: diadenylate cyclase CdaA [Elusimicrobiales bacterium]|nr:diadenylate cyclase CdaA [Elusimicrobiales bacterium]